MRMRDRIKIGSVTRIDHLHWKHKASEDFRIEPITSFLFVSLLKNANMESNQLYCSQVSGHGMDRAHAARLWITKLAARCWDLLGSLCQDYGSGERAACS